MPRLIQGLFINFCCFRVSFLIGAYRVIALVNNWRNWSNMASKLVPSIELIVRKNEFISLFKWLQKSSALNILKSRRKVGFWDFFNWNDRRWRRVFFCFYSAIFQLTSAKFQTFTYNSRTVWYSFMKFWQQFEINELYVCTKFWGNKSRDFGFRTRKPPRKFGVKSGLSQKRLKYDNKYFIGWYVSRYPFIPTNPLLAAIRFISFFFLPNFCTLFFS